METPNIIKRLAEVDGRELWKIGRTLYIRFWIKLDSSVWHQMMDSNVCDLLSRKEIKVRDLPQWRQR